MITKSEDTILIALSNDKEINIFRDKVIDKGFKPLTTNDGSKAMELALKYVPSLIIVDMSLPTIDGERLFQILTHNPNVSNVPFMFVSEVVRDVKGFRINIDSFIARPFKWDEVMEKIKESMLYGDTVGQRLHKDIEGRLSQMALVDILQVLHFNKKEGELILSNNDQHGIVFMKDGQVYNAILGEVEKEKALYRLFTWKDGKFEFIPQRVTTPQKIELPTGNLMMEGMQQIDEFERDKDKFPNKSSILQLKVDSTSVPKGLKPIIYEVLFLIDYYPKVENLVDHCSFTDYDVYTTIIDLVGRGVVDVTEVSEDIEMAELHTFISPSDAIKIKEKVVNRWDDMLTSNYAKIFIVSVNPELANKFILSCKSIPDFVIDSKLISDNNSTRNLLGQMGVLKLYGGLDMVFFSLPTASAMGPLINALSSNLVGLILLWDDTKLEWGSVVEGLAVTKNEILHHRKVPFLGVYCGENELTDELKESYIKTMGIEDNPETLMTFDNKNDESVQDILKKFFDELIKDKNKGSVKV